MRSRTLQYRLIAWIPFLFAMPSFAQEAGICLLAAAREQIGVTILYDPSYRRIAYPNGDVSVDRGVCTDVVIRAYRRFDIDLQQLVHEDISAGWSHYPKLWGLSRPDSNIDHRRVPNLATFFARRGESLPRTRSARDYLAGDVVTWRLTSGVPHIGLVSDRRTEAGHPLVVHNIGRGAVVEDILFHFEITGHYRLLPTELTRCRAGMGVGVEASGD
jgi:uncharacterized protein YijF (DUF1287 family)